MNLAHVHLLLNHFPTVGMIVGAMAAGRTIEQLLGDFPYIEEADIREALAYAASLAQGHEIRLAS